MDTSGDIVVDGREGAEEEAADVGEGGSAAGGDAVAGEQIVEMIQGMVDLLRGLEAVGALHERDEKVGVFFKSPFLGEVMGAEAGMRVRSEETALAAAGGKEMRATSVWCDGFYGQVRHGVYWDFPFEVRFGVAGIPTPGVLP